MTANIVTIKSFWSSGGSAVNDFLLEFDNISAFKQQEITLFETIDGIMDLEYRFRANRTNIPKGIQVSKFAKLVDYLSLYGQYSQAYDSKTFFGGYFRYRSGEFIKNITLEKKMASLEMEWHLKYQEEGFHEKYKVKPFRDFEKARRLAEGCPEVYGDKLKPISHYFPRDIYYIPAGEECFVPEVTAYVNDLFTFLLNREEIKGKHLVLDQMLNIDSYNTYRNRIKNLKYIIVDRDPRDVYILHREKLRSLVVPDCVDHFIIWFRSMRAGLTEELKKKALYVRFEDLIYHYDSETQRIMDYLGLKKENHTTPGTMLNPVVSKNNTQTFKSVDKYTEEIHKIEEALPEYLYDFPCDSVSDITNIF